MTNLFHSAFTEDAIWDVNGTILNGLEAIHTECYNIIFKLDTTHFIINVRVDVEADRIRATMTASALAQHYHQGQGLMPVAAGLSTGVL